MKYNLKCISDFIVENDRIWLLSSELDSLIEFDFKVNKLIKAVPFPEEENSKRPLFGNMIKIKNKIFIFPIYASDIYIYDVESSGINKMNIPFYSICNLKIKKHFRIIENEKSVFVISKIPCFIIEVSKNNYTFKMHVLKDMIVEKENWKYNICFTPCIFRGEIYIPTYNDKVIIFNIENENFYVKEYEFKLNILNSENICDWIVGFSVVNDIMWAYSFEGQIFQYNVNKFEPLKEYPIEYKKLKKNRNNVPAYRNIVGDERGLFLFPQYKNYILFYDYSQFTIIYKGYLENIDLVEFGKEIIFVSNLAIMHNWYNGKFYIFNTKTCTCSEKNIKLDIAELSEINLKMNGIYKIDCLNALISFSESTTTFINTKSNIGYNIWKINN